MKNLIVLVLLGFQLTSIAQVTVGLKAGNVISVPYSYNILDINEENNNLDLKLSLTPGSKVCTITTDDKAYPCITKSNLYKGDLSDLKRRGRTALKVQMKYETYISFLKDITDSKDLYQKCDNCNAEFVNIFSGSIDAICNSSGVITHIKVSKNFSNLFVTDFFTNPDLDWMSEISIQLRERSL